MEIYIIPALLLSLLIININNIIMIKMANFILSIQLQLLVSHEINIHYLWLVVYRVLTGSAKSSLMT